MPPSLQFEIKIQYSIFPFSNAVLKDFILLSFICSFWDFDPKFCCVLNQEQLVEILYYVCIICLETGIICLNEQSFRERTKFLFKRVSFRKKKKIMDEQNYRSEKWKNFRFFKLNTKKQNINYLKSFEQTWFFKKKTFKKRSFFIEKWFFGNQRKMIS